MQVEARGTRMPDAVMRSAAKREPRDAQRFTCAA
jgi:hypothetical protein